VTEVLPFRALRYDPARVDLAKVIAPPYDVIAPAERRALYDRDPHNAVRLELVRDVREEATTDYAQVPRALAAWRREGILVLDPRPAFYALRQRFKGPDGAPRERLACFGLVRVEDYATRSVRPHERTLAAPKFDRLKLLRAARANLSSVFLLFEDREDALPALLDDALEAQPLALVRDEAGAEHGLARIEEPERVAALRRHLAARPLVIADGHHRYETSLAYRDERRAAEPGAGPDAPFEFVLACFANAYAPGSLLLPIHRLIRRGPPPDEAAWAARLAGWSRREVVLAGPEAVPRLLDLHLAPLRDAHAFAVDDATGRLRIFWRPRARRGEASPPSEGPPALAALAAGSSPAASSPAASSPAASLPAASPLELGVRVIHREVIEGVFGLDEAAVRDGAIDYPKDAVQAARDVRAGRGAVALYLNPVRPEDVFRVTEEGSVLPQKSTFFYPKLPTGLVFRLLEETA
jgi:uncharacterized protein (DUF1015 family)